MITHVARKISNIGIMYKSSFTFLNHVYTRYTIPWFMHIFNIALLYGALRTQQTLIVLSCFRSVQLELLARKQILKFLKILKFEKNYLLHLGTFMYSYKNNLLPRSFDDSFLRLNDVYNSLL